MIKRFFEPGQHFSVGEPVNLADLINAPAPAAPAEPTATVESTEPAAEPAAEPTPTEATVPETPPTETAQPQATVEPTQAAPQEIDWKQVIKDKDKYDVLKELGYDDFIQNLIKYREQNGNVQPYLEQAGRDWDKVPSIELLKSDLQKRYPGVTGEDFDLLVEEEITHRYKQDEVYDERERRLGKIRMEQDAQRIREAEKQQQKQFVDSFQNIDRQKVEEDQARQQTEQLAAQQKAFENYIKSLPETNRLLADKKLIFGKGSESFNYVFDPASAVDAAIDNSKLFQKVYDTDSQGNKTLNMTKWAKLVAYADDMEGVEAKLINHGKNLGTKELTEKLENPTKKDTKPAQNVPESKTEAFRRAVPVSLVG